MKKVAREENLTLPDKIAVDLAQESDRNLRKALLMLEAAKVQAGGNGHSNEIPENQLLPTTDWELYIRQLARDITKEQSPQALLTAREKLYELLVNCIPASTILKTLVVELMKNLDDGSALKILHDTAVIGVVEFLHTPSCSAVVDWNAEGRKQNTSHAALECVRDVQELT